MITADHFHIAPGAIVKGENRIAEYIKIESGTVVERGDYSTIIQNFND